MRSTVTLDEDVAARIHAEMRRTGRSFKAVLNALLRSGFELRARPRAGRRFVVRSRALGLRAGVDVDDISAALEQLEGPRHR